MTNRPLDTCRMPLAADRGTTTLRWHRMSRRMLGPIAALALLGCAPAAAQAAGVEDPGVQWLPRSDGAEWVYAWSNSTYSPTPRRERYRVTARRGTSFRVSWSEIDLRADESPAAGFADFNHTDAGLVNTNYQSTQAPPQFPLLCASATQCGNSLAGSYFLLFWGTRSPVARRAARFRHALERASAARATTSPPATATRAARRSPCRRSPAASRPRRSSPTSATPARSATRSAAGRGRSGGPTASAPCGSSCATPAARRASRSSRARRWRRRRCRRTRT